MESSSAGVSVVVPTRCRPRSLRACLSHLLAAADEAGEPVEILVVDDAGHPPSWQVVEELAGTSRHPIRLLVTDDKDGHGPAAARNLALAHARHDILAFTDDDTLPDREWLRVGLARLRADPSLAGVEGAVRPAADAVRRPAQARIVKNTRGGAYQTASLFMRAAAVKRAGGFRTLDLSGRWRFHYREDTDLALRVIEEVGPIPFEPRAFVWHPVEELGIAPLIARARMSVVDAAFAQLHPEALPSLLGSPFARARLRLACVVTAALPFALPRRTRPIACAVVATGTAAMAVHAQVELRRTGYRDSPARAAWTFALQLPLSLAWSVVTALSRLEGELLLRGGNGRPDPATFSFLGPTEPSGSSPPGSADRAAGSAV